MSTATHVSASRPLPGSNAHALTGLRGWLAAAAVMGLWLLARPYTGVRHDGTLYMGQVLLHLHQEIFSHDYFFAFGSQDNFSVFSPLVAKLYAAFGMSAAQLLLLWGASAAALTCAGLLLKPLNDQRLQWMGLVSIATLTHYYGGHGIFSFAESFVTARTLAEPLALAALVLLLRERLAWALAIGLLALVVHPLMALPAFAVAWVMLWQRDRRWAWVLGLAPLILVAAAAGVSPFSALLHRYDSAWMLAVNEANAPVFVTTWGIADWQIGLLDLVVLVAVSRALPNALGHLCRATVITSVILVVVSVIGADLFHNVLVTQLQLWRVLWLAHLLALALLPTVLWRLWHHRLEYRPGAMAIAATVLAVSGRWETGWVFAVWAILLIVLARRRQPLSPAFRRGVDGANIVALVGLTFGIGARTMGQLDLAQVPINVPLIMWLAATTPALAWFAAASMLWCLGRRDMGALASGALALVLLVAGAVTWDRRTPWIRYIESARPGDHPFSRRLAPDAQVYWPDELPATWAAIGRASYWSENQGSGVLFNRDTALEYWRRRSSVAPMKLQREVCRLVAAVSDSPGTNDDCVPSLETVEALCRFPKGPDYLVFPFRLSRGVVSEWTFATSAWTKQTYYLYDCLKLR